MAPRAPAPRPTPAPAPTSAASASAAPTARPDAPGLKGPQRQRHGHSRQVCSAAKASQVDGEGTAEGTVDACPEASEGAQHAHGHGLRVYRKGA